MRNTYFLTPDEARRQYARLIDIIGSTDSIPGKAAQMRTQFDLLLHICMEAKLGRQLTRHDPSGFAVFVDELFDADTPEAVKLKQRLGNISWRFSHKSAHQYEQYKRQQQGKNAIAFSDEDYTVCISALADFIAYESGVTIPPQIQAAKKSLQRMTSGKRLGNLDVIVMLQLFESASQIAEGADVVKQLCQMLNNKNTLGLRNVTFHLVTYTPGQMMLGPLHTEADFEAHCADAPLSIDNPLAEVLKLVDGSLDRWENDGGEKPWLLMLTRSLPDCIDEAQRQVLQQLWTSKMLRFYPVAMGLDPSHVAALKKRFEQLWPGCKPYELSPRLTASFFKSVLEAIQRRLSNLSQS